MKTIRVKILLTSIFFAAAVSSALFSSEKQEVHFVMTPLLKALAEGNLTKISCLIGENADVDTPKEYTPLMAAIAYNNTDFVRLLLESRADTLISKTLLVLYH